MDPIRKGQLAWPNVCKESGMGEWAEEKGRESSSCLGPHSSRVESYESYGYGMGPLPRLFAARLGELRFGQRGCAASKGRRI